MDLSTKFHNKKSYNKYVNRISWNTTWHLSDTTPDPPGMVQVGNSSLQLFPCDQLLLDVWWRVLPSHSRCPHLLHWQAPQVDVHLHWLGSAKSACLQTHLSFSFTGLPVLPKCLFVGIPFPIIVAWTLGKLYYDNEKWVCRSLVEIKKKKRLCGGDRGEETIWMVNVYWFIGAGLERRQEFTQTTSTRVPWSWSCW